MMAVSLNTDVNQRRYRGLPELGSRALFPTLEVPVYLNHGSLSPISEAVQASINEVLAGYASRGMGWYAVETERRERLRANLAGMLSADQGEIALVGNTTAGIQAIALGLDWQPTDRVLLLEGEFPTNVMPWLQAARNHDLQTVWMEAEAFRLDRAGALERLEAELSRGVRLMAISAVQFATGQRMPLEAIGELCRRFGTELFVDAIQALGVVPLDVKAICIDYLACGSHKWLMGPEGAGLLYVDAARAGRLNPQLAGWLSCEDPFAFLTRAPGELRYDRPLRRDARLFEAGTPNSIGLAGLEASTALLTELGIDSIFDHVQSWLGALEPALVECGFESARMGGKEGRSGILSVRPPDPALAPAWAAALGAQGVACASPDGWIRFSPHWPNALSEVDTVVTAVDEIIAAGGPGQIT